MRASDWGDRNAPFFVMRPPVTLAQFEATKREIAAGWRAVPQEPEPTPITLEEVGKIALTMVLSFVAIWFVLTFLR